MAEPRREQGPELSGLGGEWAQEARSELAARGYRAGEARTAVIELLGAEGGCLEAEDVADRLRERGRSVGTASVYRALALLSDLGLLHKVAVADAAARFELVLPGGEHHHHIVCDACGRTVAFSDQGLERAVHAISERTSFQIEAHDVTLHGICEGCQEG
jgi:Fur family ferric uptake transcriptional regulator